MKIMMCEPRELSFDGIVDCFYIYAAEK